MHIKSLLIPETGEKKISPAFYVHFGSFSFSPFPFCWSFSHFLSFFFSLFFPLVLIFWKEDWITCPTHFMSASLEMNPILIRYSSHSSLPLSLSLYSRESLALSLITQIISLLFQNFGSLFFVHWFFSISRIILLSLPLSLIFFFFSSSSSRYWIFNLKEKSIWSSTSLSSSHSFFFFLFSLPSFFPSILLASKKGGDEKKEEERDEKITQREVTFFGKRKEKREKVGKEREKVVKHVVWSTLFGHRLHHIFSPWFHRSVAKTEGKKN